MMHTHTPLIKFEHVAKGFESTLVHKDISFQIDAGEVVTIMGPSGTGKTVLLKLIIGLLYPDDGKITVFGHDITKVNEETIFEIRRRIGMLFQGSALFDSLSVYDNIAYPLRQRRGNTTEEIDKIVREKLELVNLSETSEKSPVELSGGQKKRIGLARALATSPEVLLFDEPTTGLDPTSRAMIDSLITRLRDEQNITSVVVTHDMDSAQKTSDRLILVSHGKVIVQGPAAELWKGCPKVEKFASGNWTN